MTLGWRQFDRTLAEFDRLRRQMARDFESLFRFGLGAEGPYLTYGMLGVGPRMNVYDEGEDYVIVAEVPGVSGDELEISANRDSITIQGERKDDAPEGYKVWRRERSPVRFSRTFTFPSRVDADNATASLADGLLTIRVPKVAEDRPRHIEVKAG